MSNKVLCPWCGEEIEIRVCDAEWNIPFDQDAYKKDSWAGLFYCLYHPDKMDHPCPIATFRDEPLGKNLYDSEEEAYASAIRRPLQKPLTLEEACGSEEPCVYFEDRDYGEISAASVDIDFTHKNIRYKSIDVLGGYINKEESAYGKTWRCWATKPTDSEREAAKWE